MSWTIHNAYFHGILAMKIYVKVGADIVLENEQVLMQLIATEIRRNCCLKMHF